MKDSSLLRILFLFVVLFVSAESLLPWLTLSPVYEVSEGREGVVVEEMIESGNLILPLRHGEVVPSKPPLFHWMGYSFAKLSGSYGAFELRLPSALAGIGIVAVVYLLSAEICGLFAGLLSAGILLTSYGFLRTATDGRVDMVLSFFVVSAISLWISALWKGISVDGNTEVRTISRPVYLLIALLCGFGVLAKGPIGLVFPVLVIGCLSLVFGGFLGLRSAFLRWDWAAAFLVCLPWYLGAYFVGHEQFLVRQLFFENVERFVGANGITPKSPLFYLKEFWSFSVPLSLVLIPYIWTKLRRKPLPDTISEEGIKRFRFAEKVSLTWFLSLLIFLSLSVGKRRAYLLPLLPALSLLLGAWGSLFYEKWKAKLAEESFMKNLSRVGWASWILLTVTTLGLFIFCCFFAYPEYGQGTFHRVMGSYHQIFVENQSFLGPWFFCLLLIGTTTFFLGARSKSVLLLSLSLFSLAELILVVLCNTLIAAKGITHGYEQFTKEFQKRVKPEETIECIKTREDESFDAFFFQFGRRVLLHSPDTPLNPNLESRVYLARKYVVEKLPLETKDAMEVIFEGGRIKDLPEERIVVFRLVPSRMTTIETSPPETKQEKVQSETSDQPDSLPTNANQPLSPPSELQLKIEEAPPQTHQTNDSPQALPLPPETHLGAPETSAFSEPHELAEPRLEPNSSPDLPPQSSGVLTQE